MKIWIFNQYNMPPEYGHLNRHYNFAKHLNKMGYITSVFVGSYLHNTDIQIINDRTKIKKYEKSDFPYYFIKTVNYKNSKIKRVFAMFQYYKNLKKSIKNMEKPDVIIGSSGHPLAAYAAIKLGKKYKCQSIVEIRDLWPESFVEYNIIRRNNPITKLMYLGERWLYHKADKIIFTMPGGKDYVKEKGWNSNGKWIVDLDKLYNLNNGVDLERYEIDKNENIIEDSDLNSKKFKIIYAGSIGYSDQVSKIVYTAELLQKYNKEILFLIYGDGIEKKNLEQYCVRKKINNVLFKGRVEKKYIPYILSKSNLNIFPFKQSNLSRFGASLNKLFDYLASSKPILSDCEFKYDIIIRYDAGIVIDNATTNEWAKAILNFYNMNNINYNNYCKNAYSAARDFDFKKLSNDLIKYIKE